jgi:hypothetical protein
LLIVIRYMWIQRTPEEVAKWHAATHREARSHGRLIAGMMLVVVPPLVAGGWLVSLRTGAAVQQGTSGNFWARLPIFIAVTLPIAWFVYRRESKRELAKLTRRTICPKCEACGEGNDGASCGCGGTFALGSTVRWIDES